MNLICIFKHKFYPDVMGIRVSGYSVPSEAFCMRCGKLEWVVNGCTHIPKKCLKPHIESLLTKETNGEDKS